MPVAFSTGIVAFNINPKSPVVGFSHDSGSSSQKVTFPGQIITHPGQLRIDLF